MYSEVPPASEPNQPASFPLKVYYQNVRGLRTKKNTLLLPLLDCDLDIVVLTETWLHCEIASSEFASNYVIYRCDRNASTSNLCRGGGVLIAVKSELQCISVNLVDCDCLEQATVRIILPQFSLYVSCIYIRPNSCPDIYTKHADSISQILNRADPCDVIVCLGDYNLPNLVWYFDDEINGYLPINASTEQELALPESLLSSGLHQINDLMNANGKLLDLVFVSDPCIIDLFESPSALLKIDPHHKPLVLTVDVRSRDETSVPISTVDHNFNRCDYQIVNARIAALDWNHVMNYALIDDSVTAFYRTIKHIIQENVPVKICRPSKKYNQLWWTAQLRNFRNRLRKCRKKFFRNRIEANAANLRLAEEEYTRMQHCRFREYMESLQANLKNDASSFWAYIKKKEGVE
ncbi:uncharacterized protein LOC134206619 [Armigeres subalbatus]|uniref:uncharacterized protein LOC134206619 n=1 Tax=Armigeres subalbatus TaxID=124917 RepID=UPI002ED473EE